MSDTDIRKQAFLKRLGALRAVDPALYLAGLDTVADLRHADLRHVRADSLHGLIAKLQEAIRLTGFQDEIVFREDGVFVRIDGILLDTLAQKIYLKSSGEKQRSFASRMNAVLASHGIRPQTIVDVGANYAEVSLWFAREHPQARIVAIEPVKANLEVLRKNLAAQSFPTSNIEVVPVAVTDRTGSIHITAGVSTMNRVSEQKQDGTESVQCDTLENIFAKHAIAASDFVKVDIEGAEPLLQDSVTALASRVRAWMFEFSKFAPLQDYLDLAHALMSAGYAVYEEDGRSPLADIVAVQQHLLKVLTPREVLVTNLWFVRR